MHSSLSGIFAAALTPMHADLSCDYDSLATHCKDLMLRGCSGVVLFGTTGEGPSFSLQERQSGVKEVIRRGIDSQKIIFCVNCNAITDAVSLTQTAAETGCQAVLVAPPSFYKNIEEAAIIAFYREIIKRINDTRLKVILYHFPKLTGVPITLPVIQSLVKEFPETVVGIKESEGNLSFTKQILENIPNFNVLVGKELQIAEAVHAGAAGSICGLANAYPELLRSLYEYGKDSTKPNHSAELEKIAADLKQYPTFPAIKALVAKQKGSAWIAMRPPLLPLFTQ